MRIAHLTTADISLALLLSTELAEAVQEGHEVLGISAPGPYVERVEALGVRHVPILALTRSWDLRRDLRAFVSLWRSLRSLDLDVLHTHNPKTGVMGRIAGRLAGVPVVVNTCHGLWATPEDSLFKRAFVYGLEGLAARFSDFELFQNAQDEATLRRFLKPGRHRVVGNGVDLERFRFDPEGRARLRAEWGVTDEEVLVGTVGRRVAEKGMVEYAAAATALEDRARFVWVGPADDAAQLPEAGTASLRFIDEQTDMPAVYSAFDLFVLASYREGFSRASMEAAACGRPMVLTDIRGCREIGRDGVHLRLVPPRAAVALTAAIRELVDDHAARSRLGAAAADRAHDEFDQKRVAQVSRDTYTHILLEADSVAPTRPVRVLHVVPADISRGVQVYVRALRDALGAAQDQEHRVVALFSAGPDSAFSDIPLGVRSGAARRLGLDVRAAFRLRRAIKSTRADLVVAHGGESLKYVVATGTRVKRIYYKVGLSSEELARWGRLSLYRFLAARTDLVVVVSGAILDQVRDLLRVPARKIRIIPNGRDPAVYRADPGQVRSVPHVLWIGQFERGKRPSLFLDVVEMLRVRGLRFSASMLGDGPLRQSLMPRADSLSVDLPGVVPDVPDRLRRSDVLVMTSMSDTEGMPGVLIEAGLSGVPVVATPSGGVHEVIEHGTTGYVTETADDLDDRVASLLLDDERRHFMGAAAIERCGRLFSMRASAGRWEDLVRELAPRRLSGSGMRPLEMTEQ